MEPVNVGPARHGTRYPGRSGRSGAESTPCLPPDARRPRAPRVGVRRHRGPGRPPPPPACRAGTRAAGPSAPRSGATRASVRPRRRRRSRPRRDPPPPGPPPAGTPTPSPGDPSRGAGPGAGAAAVHRPRDGVLLRAPAGVRAGVPDAALLPAAARRGGPAARPGRGRTRAQRRPRGGPAALGRPRVRDRAGAGAALVRDAGGEGVPRRSTPRPSPTRRPPPTAPRPCWTPGRRCPGTRTCGSRSRSRAGRPCPVRRMRRRRATMGRPRRPPAADRTPCTNGSTCGSHLRRRDRPGHRGARRAAGPASARRRRHRGPVRLRPSARGPHRPAARRRHPLPDDVLPHLPAGGRGREHARGRRPDEGAHRPARRGRGAGRRLPSRPRGLPGGPRGARSRRGDRRASRPAACRPA